MSFCFCLESVPSGENQSVAGGDEDVLDEYQELSTREEQDIESMMETCEYAISNAEAFAEQLSRELQVLDGVSQPMEYVCIIPTFFSCVLNNIIMPYIFTLQGQHPVHYGVRKAG